MILCLSSSNLYLTHPLLQPCLPLQLSKATAYGPSGLRVQHILDALDANLPTSIDSLLCQVIKINLLITGNVPAALAPYLAGGNLTALLKLKELGWNVI